MIESDEIKRLKGEIEYLKGEIAELYHLLNLEIRSSSKHLKELYKRVKKVNKYSNDSIANLYDIVFPIEQTIFPGVSRARQALTDIAESSEGDDPFEDHPNKKNS